MDKFVGQDLDILDRQGAEGEVAAEMAKEGRQQNLIQMSINHVYKEN